MYIGAIVDGDYDAGLYCIACGGSSDDVKSAFIDWTIQFCREQNAKPGVIGPRVDEDVEMWDAMILMYLEKMHRYQRDQRWPDTERFLEGCMFLWKIWRTGEGVQVPIWLPSVREKGKLEIFDCTVDETFRWRP